MVALGLISGFFVGLQLKDHESNATITNDLVERTVKNVQEPVEAALVENDDE